MKILTALILAITLWVYLHTDYQAGYVEVNTYIIITRPEPIDWAIITPDFTLITQQELTHAEREALR